MLFYSRLADCVTQYCSSEVYSKCTYLLTVAQAGAIGHVYAGASAAAVQRAVKLVDGDGIRAVRVVIALHTSVPDACKQMYHMHMLFVMTVSYRQNELISRLLTHSATCHAGVTTASTVLQ